MKLLANLVGLVNNRSSFRTGVSQLLRVLLLQFLGFQAGLLRRVKIIDDAVAAIIHDL